jgi:hypothetical protein
MVARELSELRHKRDDHIADGRLRLAGECSLEIEQLTREYLALQPRAQASAASWPHGGVASRPGWRAAPGSRPGTRPVASL